MSLEVLTDLRRRYKNRQWRLGMPLLLFVPMVVISLEYRRLSEKQSLFCLDKDDQLIYLVRVFAGATQLWFWIWDRKRIARACIGYMPLFLAVLYFYHR